MVFGMEENLKNVENNEKTMNSFIRENTTLFLQQFKSENQATTAHWPFSP